MPTSMTFASLQADLQTYLERGTALDPLVFAQLPELINFAERRISRELKVLGFIVSATFNMQANLAVYAKPDRWRQIISINVGSSPTGTIVRSNLYPRSYEYLRTYWPDDTATGPPKFYAEYNYQNIILAPTPDQAYPAEMMYYEEPALLDNTNTTNWITQYAPNLLLYSALLECSPFLKNDSRIGVWQAMYEQTKAALNGESQAGVIDRTSTREET